MHWQARVELERGGVVLLGVEADDASDALAAVYLRTPYLGSQIILDAIEPPCRLHRVRHTCEAGERYGTQ